MPQRVLVTNDDGIDADGLRVLVAALVDRGYEPIVVAPDSDYSGAGTSLLGMKTVHFETHREIPYERRELPEAPGAEAYAIGAAPAMCVLLAMRGAFGERPDLVVSGINFGLNTGMAVRHSGTVSAALTATSFDIPALAISAQFLMDQPEVALRYDTAAEVGMQVLEIMADSGHAALSLNVPNRSIDELEGIRSAPMATRSSFESYVEDRTDAVLKLAYRVVDQSPDEGSDSALVKAGFAVVSSVAGPSAHDCSDIIGRLEKAA